MNVVVAGATGGIGRSVVAQLRDRGDAVFPMGSLEVDLRIDISGACAFFKAVEPEAIIHLAGSKPPAPADALYANNTAITYVLLESARRAAPNARHIVTSSAAVYADSPSSYGISKRVTEAIAAEFRDRHGIDIVIARPFNVTALENDTFSVIPQLVARMRRHCAGNFVVRDIDAVRDFIDVGDVSRAYVTAIHAPSPPAIFDVGTGIGTTIGDLARRIAVDLDRDVSIVAGERSAHISISVADVGELHRLGAPAALGRDATLSRAIAIANDAA